MNKFEECCVFLFVAVLFVNSQKSCGWGFCGKFSISFFLFVSRYIPSSKNSVSMIYSVLSIININTKIQILLYLYFLFKVQNP